MIIFPLLAIRSMIFEHMLDEAQILIIIPLIQISLHPHPTPTTHIIYVEGLLLSAPECVEADRWHRVFPATSDLGNTCFVMAMCLLIFPASSETLHSGASNTYLI